MKISEIWRPRMSCEIEKFIPQRWMSDLVSSPSDCMAYSMIVGLIEIDFCRTSLQSHNPAVWVAQEARSHTYSWSADIFRC